jgi:hypothetical protein
MTEFANMGAFIAGGIEDVLPEKAEICGICKDPLLTAETSEEKSEQDTPGENEQAMADTNHVADHDNSTSMFPEIDDTPLVPEQATKIKKCGHILGKVCLLTWLGYNNICPTCRAVLFGGNATADRQPILSPAELRSLAIGIMTAYARGTAYPTIPTGVLETEVLIAMDSIPWEEIEGTDDDSFAVLEYLEDEYDDYYDHEDGEYDD